MKHIIIYITTLIFIFISGFSGASAQQLSEEQLKSVLIYKFIDNIEWPNEKNMKTFNVGILMGDTELEAAVNLLNKKIVKLNKKIKVKSYPSIADISNVDLVVLPYVHSRQIESLVDKVEGAHTLIVSDQCSSQKKVMINFLKPDDKKMKFEINKANIINAGLRVKSNSLILLGGTEIDVAELYKESQESLENEREKVKQQSAEIEEQRKQIETQTKEIQKQKEEMLKQQIAIDKQQAQINEQKHELETLLKSIENQQILLAQTKDTLNAQVTRLVEQEKSMKKQKSEMDRRNEILIEQEEKIEAQENKIADHKATLLKQTATIALQKNLMYVFALFILLILSLAFLIYRGYRLKKKSNQMLQEMNSQILEQKNEIESQAEELTAQTEALSTMNEELERQKEYTTASIRYGLTIQNAMLPVRKEISKTFPSFILFRPKDIVSGDFYWYTQVEHKNYSFIAVVDCTGHGVPGAFMSMIGSHLLSAIVNEKDIFEPKDILEELNLGIKKALKQDINENDDGMDMCLCRLEPKNENETKVIFSGAKRPLYYIDNGKLVQIKGNIKAIGGRYYDNMEFTQTELTLSKRSRLLLTTDGYPDQCNIKRDRFTNARMLELFKKSSSKSLEKQQIIFEDELEKHQGKEVQRDDITLICVELPKWSDN